MQIIKKKVALNPLQPKFNYLQLFCLKIQINNLAKMVSFT